MPNSKELVVYFSLYEDLNKYSNVTYFLNRFIFYWSQRVFATKYNLIQVHMQMIIIVSKIYNEILSLFNYFTNKYEFITEFTTANAIFDVMSRLDIVTSCFYRLWEIAIYYWRFKVQKIIRFTCGTRKSHVYGIGMQNDDVRSLLTFEKHP